VLRPSQIEDDIRRYRGASKFVWAAVRRKPPMACSATSPVEFADTAIENGRREKRLRHSDTAGLLIKDLTGSRKSGPLLLRGWSHRERILSFRYPQLNAFTPLHDVSP
jgi:hypothetical protein